MLTLWMAASFALAAPGAAPSPDPGYCDPDDPKRCAQPLQRGQPAPWDGQLLTPELALDLGLKVDGCAAKLQLELDFANKSADIELNLEKQLRQIDQTACQESRATLQRQIDEALQPPPFYERPWFVASVTAILTVTAASLVIWGAGQLR